MSDKETVITVNPDNTTCFTPTQTRFKIDKGSSITSREILKRRGYLCRVWVTSSDHLLTTLFYFCREKEQAMRYVDAFKGRAHMQVVKEFQ